MAIRLQQRRAHDWFVDGPRPGYEPEVNTAKNRRPNHGNSRSLSGVKAVKVEEEGADFSCVSAGKIG